MSVLLQNTSVLKSISGEGLDPAANVSKKILHIDTDLQIPNRIHKSATDNKVKQITDKAQGIIFAQSDSAKQPVYNYGGYYLCSTAHVSANDIPVIANSMFYFHVNLDNHSAIATTGILYQKGNFIIRQKANANNIEIVINSSVIIDYAYIYSTEYYYAIVLSSTDCYLVENGIIKAIGAYSGLLATGITDLFGDGTNYFKGKVYSIKRFDTDIYSVIGKSVNANVGYNIGDFQHYQRYPDNGTHKVFFSSKYLKDTVIDSADNITSLKDSIQNLQVDYYTGGTKPKWTKNGILLNRAAISSLRVNSYYVGSITNTLIGGWHNPTSNTGNQNLFVNSIGDFTKMFLIGWSTPANCYWLYDGATVFSSAITHPINSYNHVIGIKLGSSIYLIVNGIMERIATHKDVSYTGTHNIYMGQYPANLNYCDGYFDDFLVEHGTLSIDPTSYVVGDKVFEPPTRGGFDGTFKIY